MASKEVKAGAAYVELFVTDNKLSQGLRSASKRITQWADRTQKQLKSIGTGMMSGGMLGLGLTGAVGGGLFALTKSFSDIGDQLADMTQRTGMSAEYLSEMGHAAKLCGADIGLVEKSVHKMQMLMLDASQGTQKSIDVLNDLGLSYQQLATLSPEQQFDAIIARLGQMDEANRAAHAMEVFGRSAHQLMPLINAGTKEIAAMRNEARQLGISMSGPDAEANHCNRAAR